MLVGSGPAGEKVGRPVSPVVAVAEGLPVVSGGAVGERLPIEGRAVDGGPVVRGGVGGSVGGGAVEGGPVGVGGAVEGGASVVAVGVEPGSVEVAALLLLLLFHLPGGLLGVLLLHGVLHPGLLLSHVHVLHA
jgi:hypothetical protein